MSVLHKFYLMRLNFSFVFVFEGLNVGVLYLSPTQKMRLDWGERGKAVYVAKCLYPGRRPGFTDLEKSLYFLGLHCFSYKMSAFN